MAERRMFAKAIVLSDAFLDMPMSARCLYFTLSMLADDDGFVGAPKSIIRQCGASQDDLVVLLQKRFILGFDSGIIVIKHWRINNYLRSDRHQSTTYIEELATLTTDDKDAYVEADKLGGIPTGNQVPTTCLPSDNQMATQYRIGKDSIGKESIGKDSIPIGETESNFEVWWKAYPKKVGKQDAKKSYAKALKMPGVTAELLLTAVQEQKMSEQWAKDNGQYIPNPATWLNQGRWDDELKGGLSNGRADKSGRAADSRWNIHYTNE